MGAASSASSAALLDSSLSYLLRCDTGPNLRKKFVDWSLSCSISCSLRCCSCINCRFDSCQAASSPRNEVLYWDMGSGRVVSHMLAVSWMDGSEGSEIMDSVSIEQVDSLSMVVVLKVIGRIHRIGRRPELLNRLATGRALACTKVVSYSLVSSQSRRCTLSNVVAEDGSV